MQATPEARDPRIERILRALTPALAGGGAFPDGDAWSGLDWQGLRRRLTQERAPVLVYYLLSRHPRSLASCPEDFVAWLKASYYVAAGVAAIHSQALGDFLRSARAKGLPILVLRGAALSEVYYGDPALRPAADEDILVRRSDIAGVEGLCREMGLLRLPGMAGVTYGGRSPLPLMLDIHTGIWHEKDEKSLWARALPVRLADQQAFRLGPEDMALNLVFHAAVHHGRFSARDAVDLALVCAPVGGAPRWDFLLEMTAHAGLEAVLRHCLRETRERTHASVPDEILERLRLKGLRSWEEGFYRWNTVSFDRPGIGRYLTLLATKGVSSKLRYLWDFLFPPADFLARRYGLASPWQIAAFRLLRPLLLLKAGLAGFRKSWGG